MKNIFIYTKPTKWIYNEISFLMKCVFFCFFLSLSSSLYLSALPFFFCSFWFIRFIICDSSLSRHITLDLALHIHWANVCVCVNACVLMCERVWLCIAHFFIFIVCLCVSVSIAQYFPFTQHTTHNWNRKSKIKKNN